MLAPQTPTDLISPFMSHASSELHLFGFKVFCNRKNKINKNRDDSSEKYLIVLRHFCAKPSQHSVLLERLEIEQ